MCSSPVFAHVRAARRQTKRAKKVGGDGASTRWLEVTDEQRVLRVKERQEDAVQA